MVVEIGKIVKSFLHPLVFIDKLAGVVKILTKKDQDDTGKSYTKKIPIDCDVSFEDCSAGKYKDLLPDTSLGCIVFLEDNGCRFLGIRGTKQSWKAYYKLVGWVNNAKLGSEQCSVTGLIIASIINAMPVNLFNSGNYQAINIQVIGQDPKTGGNPYSRYGIDEEKTQLLLYPCDAFSLQIEVSFEIDRRCLTSFVKQTEVPCQ